MQKQTIALKVMEFLKSMPEVKGCELYGSLKNGSGDVFSDIDLEVDVSGYDNGNFALNLAERMNEKFVVIYRDFAPSLAPEKYVVTIALDEEDPFATVDIAVTGKPHCASVSRQQLNALNNPYDHNLKLFTANLKHFLRGVDCRKDIEKMFTRLGENPENIPEKLMLEATYTWLVKNAHVKHRRLLEEFSMYL